ncbi:DUF302 domain-containing protein [Lihuaxuella thermophila]|uniref:Uncharacterized conserved protein, DUF302 family n=1 Tax=Lihuaxuella thermophila TaxID=1173111 RepID=A0A1H8GU07_9BACL|nr:DUF302 domain-containing protein [Lihuaxuella thermophila]SEN47355.1 Uncharacterized conserved protein, DUF302 family [Lihuaxuella thermophila]
MFSYLVETGHTVEGAVKSLERKLADMKLQLLWKYDVTTKLFEQGIRLDQDYWILEVSHPDLTKKMLVQNQWSGFFLPCKMVVFSDRETGKTQVGILRPTSAFSHLEDPVLRDLASRLEEQLISVLNEIEQQQVV